jgi:membrane protein implicated in regulation of membrane protease activity
MEQAKQDMTFAQRLRDTWDNLRQANLRAQLHYLIFRAAQQFKQKNSLLIYYRERFTATWPKWLGIGAGLTGLMMLFNPDEVWRWQWLWVIAFVLLAPLLEDMLLVLQKLLTEYPGKHFIGQVISLEEGIIDGKAEVRLENQVWQVAGSDCSPQTRVRVIAINDRTLYVTPLEQAA